MPNTQVQAHEIITFWFEEIDKKLWFKKDASFDDLLKKRFLETLKRAEKSELFTWRETTEGRLAEIIVLDQFSRNIYRDKSAAFSNDALALCLSQEAVAQGLDTTLTSTKQSFLYMPYMHSESLEIHDKAVQLFSKPGLEDNLRFEHRHRDIIEKFGRYPHRNEILARDSSTEEIAFLSTPGSSF